MSEFGKYQVWEISLEVEKYGTTTKTKLVSTCSDTCRGCILWRLFSDWLHFFYKKKNVINCQWEQGKGCWALRIEKWEDVNYVSRRMNRSVNVQRTYLMKAWHHEGTTADWIVIGVWCCTRFSSVGVGTDTHQSQKMV